jgi:exodeoxyribonuclease VII small subunit
MIDRTERSQAEREEQPGERFEDRLARLEQVVERLEDEAVGLEEALELFEGGMELARSCRSRLEEVEQRVARLLSPDEAAENDPPEGSGSRTVPLEIDEP